MKTITLRVLQFNTFVKNILDNEDFLSNIAIYGEVTNFKISGGHAYFDLKDEAASVSCVKFGAGDLNLKNGDMITVYGKVNFYVKSGRLNFVVAKAEAYGLGALYQKFLELKAKLEKEGYFSETIKKPIPKFAKRLGVVTSETGAVIRDIIHVTKSKNPYTDIVVYPSKVQGIGAEDEIASGIEYFNTRNDIDVIIVARGGGSASDLEPFNTEKIVHAIYNSNLPVISAVGHETDFTLCDFAADIRVPTPSVAAEVAVFNYKEQVENIRLLAENNSYLASRLLLNKKQQVIAVGSESAYKLKLKLGENSSLVLSNAKDISSKVKQIFERKKSKFEVLFNVLSKQNPLEILKSGYSVIEKDKKKIVSVKNLSVGDEILVTVNDGDFLAKVTEIKK